MAPAPSLCVAAGAAACEKPRPSTSRGRPRRCQPTGFPTQRTPRDAVAGDAHGLGGGWSTRPRPLLRGIGWWVRCSRPRLDLRYGGRPSASVDGADAPRGTHAGRQLAGRAGLAGALRPRAFAQPLLGESCCQLCTRLRLETSTIENRLPD